MDSINGSESEDDISPPRMKLVRRDGDALESDSKLQFHLCR